MPRMSPSTSPATQSRLAALVIAAAAILQAGWAPLDEPPPRGTAPGPAGSDLTVEHDGNVQSTEFDDVAQGDQPYTPTRTEWLCFMANSVAAKDLLDSYGYSVTYAQGPAVSNEVVVVGRYDPARVSKQQVQVEVELASDAMKSLAQRKGWHKWLKLRTDLRMIHTSLAESLAASDFGTKKPPLYVPRLAPKEHLFQGQQFLKAGNPDYAIAHFDAAIQQNPKLTVAYLLRGDVWRDQQIFDRAIADYTQALQVAPQDDLALNKRAIAWSLLGDNERATKDFDEAIAQGSQIAMQNKSRLKPDDDADDDAERLYHRGRAWARMGDLQNAALNYRQALVVDSGHAASYSGFGHVLLRMGGRAEEALQACNRALEVAPEDLEAIFYRGQALLELKQYEKATADFRQVVSRAPDYKPAAELLRSAREESLKN